MIGKTLSEYKLMKIIGIGGMSNVYLGKSINTGSLAAVKVLKKQYTQDKEHINRFFKREIEVTKNLHHRNIVSLINYGHKGDIYYLIYEYIQGVSLDKYLAKNKKLTISNIENIYFQILAGLSYAHSQGIIHRDIKPQNILFTPRGIVKITDFGIAKALSSATITQTGMFMGSPGYISPEQAEGKKVSNRSDIYSAGVVLFELLTGSLPFKSDTPWGLVHKHIYDPPPDIFKLSKNTPPYLSYIVSRCLVKNPSGRFSSVSEMASIISTKSFAGQTIVKPVVRKDTDISKKSKIIESERAFDNNKAVAYQASSVPYLRFSYVQPIWVLVLLVIFTLGIYKIIWLYRNWRDLNEHNKLGISPGWRTIGYFVPILGLVLIYNQFKDINKFASEGSQHNKFSPGLVLFGWIIFSWIGYIIFGWIIIYLISPTYSYIPLGLLIFLRLLFLILLFLILWPMTTVQNNLNSYWQRYQPDLPMRTGFSPLEIVVLVLGSIFCIILLIGFL